MQKLTYTQKSIGIITILTIWALLRSVFFGYVGFENYQANIVLTDKLFSLFIILYSLSELNLNKNRLVTLIIYGFIATYICNIAAWGSNPLQEFSGFIPILGVFSYFYLCKVKADLDTAEHFLILLAILYLFCWIVGVVNIPHLIFGKDLNGDLSNVDRGFFRLWIPNKEHMPFLLFFSLWNFIKKKSWLALLCSMIIFLIIILHVGRQMIFWSFISAVLMIIVTNKVNYIKLLLCIFLLYLFGVFITENIEGVTIMTNMTINQLENVDNDIRMHAINHYLFKFPSNFLSIIWGNGIPCENTDLRIYSNVAFKRGFFLEDIGFIAMYVRYGLWMIVLMFILLYKVIKMKVEDRFIYIKYYILTVYGMYLLGHSLTTNIFYIFIAYYILEKSSIKLKKNENKNCICFN